MAMTYRSRSSAQNFCSITGYGLWQYRQVMRRLMEKEDNTEKRNREHLLKLIYKEELHLYPMEDFDDELETRPYFTPPHRGWQRDDRRSFTYLTFPDMTGIPEAYEATRASAPHRNRSGYVDPQLSAQHQREWGNQCIVPRHPKKLFPENPTTDLARPIAYAGRRESTNNPSNDKSDDLLENVVNEEHQAPELIHNETENSAD